MASAGFPFPEAEWIPPTATDEEARHFVQNYLSWTLQRPYDDTKVANLAGSLDASATFLYKASEKQFQEVFGEELGAKFHHHMNYRSPYGRSYNMRKHLVSYSSNASHYFAGLSQLYEQSLNQTHIKKRGSASNASSVRTSTSDGVELQIPSMPSFPSEIHVRGRGKRHTTRYVMEQPRLE